VRILTSGAGTGGVTGSASYTSAAATTAGYALGFAATAGDTTEFTATNNISHSGYLTVFSGAAGAYVPSLNNINNNDSKGAYTDITVGADAANGTNQLHWSNREPDRYTTKNITLTDDRYLRFFKTMSTGIDNSGFPDMLMNGDNPVFGYVRSSGGPAKAVGDGPGTGAGTAGTGGNQYPTYAAPQRREVNGTTGAEIYTEYLIKGSTWDAMGMARDESGRYIHATTFNRDGGALHLIYDRYAEIHGSGDGWGSGIGFGGNFAHYDDNNAMALETLSYDDKLTLERYWYPKIIAKGNSMDTANTATAGAAYYMFYFDDGTKELIFRTFRIRSNTRYTQRAAFELYRFGFFAEHRQKYCNRV